MMFYRIRVEYCAEDTRPGHFSDVFSTKINGPKSRVFRSRGLSWKTVRVKCVQRKPPKWPREEKLR